jgi:hypothetical protein
VQQAAVLATDIKADMLNEAELLRHETDIDGARRTLGDLARDGHGAKSSCGFCLESAGDVRCGLLCGSE